jgi:sugar lactone lactonase YvrE
MTRTMPFLRRLLPALALLAASSTTHAAPVAAEGYTLELVSTGVGAGAGTGLAPDGAVWVTDYGGGRVLRVSPQGVLSVVATGLPYPTDVAVSETGRVFVSSGGGGAIYEIVEGSTSLLAAGFSAPTSVALRAGGLYVANSGNGSIVRLDLATLVQTTVASGVGNPYGLAFDAGGKLHFLDNASGRVMFIDANGKPGITDTLGANVGIDLAIGFDGRLVVAEANAARLLRWPVGDMSKVIALLRWPVSDNSKIIAGGFAVKAVNPAIGPHGLTWSGRSLYVVDGDSLYRLSMLPSVSRSLRVEKRHGGLWRVSCELQYGDIDGDHSYAIELAISHRDGVTTPAGGTVSPKAARLKLGGEGSASLVARLNDNSLNVERTLWLTQAPLNGDSISCRGGARNLTTGHNLPSVQMSNVHGMN